MTTKAATEFDKVFTELESPDYPATCDQCGAEGTNASMGEHICDESHSLKSLSALLKDPSYMTLPRTRQIAIKHAHWNATRLPNNEFSLSWQDTKVLLDMNATLIEQREHVLEALKKCQSYVELHTPEKRGLAGSLLDVIDNAIATIEQEREVESNTNGEMGR